MTTVWFLRSFVANTHLCIFKDLDDLHHVHSSLVSVSVLCVDLNKVTQRKLQHGYHMKQEKNVSVCVDHSELAKDMKAMVSKQSGKQVGMQGQFEKGVCGYTTFQPACKPVFHTSDSPWLRDPLF